MMKKLTAYILIFLANILLLSHAVLPHHHHQLQFCIEDSHCQHHEVPNPYDDDHSHDNESSANCILNQLIISLGNQAKQECKFTDLSDGHFPSFDWHVIDLHNELQDIPLFEICGVVCPSVKSSYYYLLSGSSGLRAPPAV